MEKGLLVVISGPSGVGKGTIFNSLLDSDDNIARSISVTTRAPREGEEDGVHYYFKTLEEYQQMIANGDFLETASVYSNCYGTPKQPVFDMIKSGKDVVFEIDILGAKQIKAKYPEAILIYIMTDSFEILRERLVGRGSETEESLKRRLGSAKSELEQHEIFDYIVFNDDIDKAVERVLGIFAAEKSKIAINKKKILTILNSEI